jgi:hypothetical protein
MEEKSHFNQDWSDDHNMYHKFPHNCRNNPDDYVEHKFNQDRSDHHNMINKFPHDFSSRPQTNDYRLPTNYYRSQSPQNTDLNTNYRLPEYKLHYTDQRPQHNRYHEFPHDDYRPQPPQNTDLNTNYRLPEYQLHSTDQRPQTTHYPDHHVYHKNNPDDHKKHSRSIRY